MVRFWIIDHAHQGLDDLLSLGGRLPVLSGDDGEAHLALLINVGVVDLGPEGHLGRFEGILGREDQVYEEGPLVVRSLVRH